MYWDHRCLPAPVEHLLALGTMMRVGYAYLVHAEWLPPSMVRTLDYQTNIPVAHLDRFRRNIHTNELTRCATMHPDRSCRQFAITGTLNLLCRSTQVFVPLQCLSLAGSVFVARKQTSVQWTALTNNVGRSVMFLTWANMAPLLLSCSLPQTRHKLTALVASMLPYLMLQVEPRKRRASVLKAIACWTLVSLQLQATSSRVWRRYVTKLSLAKRMPWTWVATAVYGACMTHILNRPHLQSHLAMQYLFGKSMHKPPST
ncbi:hypothetical protein DYB31_014855 [Aphanomyces astaci]|uniref:Transmembrane protein 135 N-terminal domain-containing protein n=1 Tax=Aphanomyces astaci TaxID=112090 RepID=A0A397ESC4_APHAT|nr:hypothetical protein DYB31_014855 [Aphanomyces astaci]